MVQAIGRIKWYDERVERGVIVAEDGREYFVYKSNIVSGTPLKRRDVWFEYDPSKVARPGLLPKAYRIIISEPQHYYDASAAEVLSGGSDAR